MGWVNEMWVTCWLLGVGLMGVARGGEWHHHEECTFPPLCGSANQTFHLTDKLPPYFPLPVYAGAKIEFEDCCSLTAFEQYPDDCKVVNPSGESSRYITSFDPICESDPTHCTHGTCKDYVLALKPTMIQAHEDNCCQSCSCYGDPQCVSFDGTHKIWVLCDGREVPYEGDESKYCRITEKECCKQKDQAGHECVYLAKDEDGKDWDVSVKGSPCVPNPKSPPSEIVMYEVDTPKEHFLLKVTQGERGIIYKVDLELAGGDFVLTAESCLSKGKNAWATKLHYLPSYFVYTDLAKSKDVLWDIVDPETGIAINIRCYGAVNNGKLVLPRINVEAVSDPTPKRKGTSGFCVTNKFPLGLATTDNTEKIESGQLCIDGLQEFDKLLTYRAICQNPALTQTAIDQCIYFFCSANYVPLYDSVNDCVDAFKRDVSKGFCKAVVYMNSDVDECVSQWNTVGAVETVKQYLEDMSGCVHFSETKKKPSECEQGVTLQYLQRGKWIDALFLPENFCPGELIEISKCKYPQLFTNPIRFVQTSNKVACGPINQCKRITGFQSFIGLHGPPTPSPTNPPTPFPTQYPASEYKPPTHVSSCPLCGTEEVYSPLNYHGEFSTKMESCCTTDCRGEPLPNVLQRDRGTNQAYCGDKKGEHSPFKPYCKDNDELEVKVIFSKDDDTVCCLNCTCYGDPRCTDFDGNFEEFILCDGREIPESADDRCIITKKTCLEQKDHKGHACIWYNENKTPPNFYDHEEQDKAERNYKVALYGSPCTYDETLSGPSLLNLYSVDHFKVSAQQFERGYIHDVNITTKNGMYSLNVTDCLAGKGFYVRDQYGVQKDYYHSVKFGPEITWNFVDANTNIEVSILCTGVFQGGKISTPFINLQINEPNIGRARNGKGFCPGQGLDGRKLSSYEHSQYIRDNNLCEDWNLLTTNIILRNSARAILNDPGLPASGTKGAFTKFCNRFYAYGYNSEDKCVSDFMDSKTVDDMIHAFCRAVTLDRKPCIETIQMSADMNGYIEAFNEARVQFVETYDRFCPVLRSSDLLEKEPDTDVCRQGVVLQYLEKGEWKNYKVFPADLAPCFGFTVLFNGKSDPELFQYPIRLLQKSYPTQCTACDFVEAVYAKFKFSSHYPH